jgi:hypothetical protein
VVARISLLIVCLLFSDVLAAASLTATVDKKDIIEGEHVQLTLSLVNSDTRLRAQGISPNIDLTLLTKDFELGIPRETHRFNITRERGRSTSELTVELFPKHAGEFIIPSFTVDNVSSQPVHIRVQKGSADATPEVFARSGVTKHNVWQREQIIAYLDLYHRIELKSAKLGGDIDIEPTQLELHKLKESQRKEKVAGLTYNVERSEWAITPFLDRDYKVYLPDIWIVTSDDRKIRLPFEEQHLDVKTLPGDVPPLAMVGKPEITQNGLDTTAHVDGVSPWTITVRAPASPTAFPDELPGLNMSDNIKLYRDTIERSVDQESTPVMGVANYRLYLIPLSAGDFTLPEINIPYFDPRRGIMDVATLNSQTLAVEPALHTSTPTAVNADVSATVHEITASDSHTSALVWKVLSLAVIMLWLITLGLWWMTRKRTNVLTRPQTQTPSRNSNHPLQSALLDAFGARTLEQGLNKWERLYGNDPEIRNTVRAVQEHIYSKDKPAGDINLRAAVTRAVEKITRVMADKHTHDPWSPRAFTPRLTFIEEKR